MPQNTFFLKEFPEKRVRAKVCAGRPKEKVEGSSVAGVSGAKIVLMGDGGRIFIAFCAIRAT